MQSTLGITRVTVFLGLFVLQAQQAQRKNCGNEEKNYATTTDDQQQR
jgi:hypothetical protein